MSYNSLLTIEEVEEIGNFEYVSLTFSNVFSKHSTVISPVGIKSFGLLADRLFKVKAVDERLYEGCEVLFKVPDSISKSESSKLNWNDMVIVVRAFWFM